MTSHSDTPRTTDRSDAVNLASNIISRRDTGSYAHGVTDKGMKRCVMPSLRWIGSYPP